MGAKIGFVGLGQMGKWMALNLVQAGFDVTVYDIDAGAVGFLTKEGARSASTPAEMAAGVDWLLLSLPNTTIVEKVIFGESGVLQGANPGLILIDLGTTSYGATLDFARRLEGKGIRFADAPVSGMEARAKEGTLTLMYGGDGDLFDEIRPAFEPLSNKILNMGPVGSGQLTKLINQLLFNISAAAIAEVLPMAVKLGLDAEKVLEVVNSGTGRSWAAEFFGPRILDGLFHDGYPLKHAYKDMISAAEICAHQQIPLPMVHAATTTYQMALLQGLGDEDKGAMIKVFEQLLGVEFRRRE